MRSGSTSYSVPCSLFTPCTTILSVPAPVIFAPMEMRKFARSTTSGSRAAFSSTVSPSASVAAIIRFSVPVTVTVSSTSRAPFSRCARARMYPPSMVMSAPIACKPGDVNVHRPRTDGAAAGQRDVRLAKARHERTEHEDGGAHRLHQIVGRRELRQRRSVHFDAHVLVQGDACAHAPQQLDSGGDVLQVRHVADDHRLFRQQRAGQNGQRGVLRARDAHLALERRAAG